MEGVVADPLVGEARQRRRMDRAAEGVGQPEADVIQQDDEDIGRVLGQMACLDAPAMDGSCNRGSATLAEGAGGKGSMDPSSGPAAALPGNTAAAKTNQRKLCATNPSGARSPACRDIQPILTPTLIFAQTSPSERGKV